MTGSERLSPLPEGRSHSPASTVPKQLVANPPQLLILDVDGVLTDNTITLDEDGCERKRFFVPDGAGIRLLQRVGVGVALVSGRQSSVVAARARELSIEHAASGVHQKKPHVIELMQLLGVPPENTVYVGDDWIDIPPMSAVGLPIAVANAIPEVHDVAIATTTRPGGAGAVREVCDWIIRARGDHERLAEEVTR